MRYHVRMPFEDYLSLRVTRRHKDGVTTECAIGPQLLNSNGVLHGGITASIADEAAWQSIEHHFAEKRSSTTVELKINYLRPIPPGKLKARAYLLRAGRSLCVSRVDMFDPHKRLAATALVTYMLLGNGKS